MDARKLALMVITTLVMSMFSVFNAIAAGVCDKVDLPRGCVIGRDLAPSGERIVIPLEMRLPGVTENKIVNGAVEDLTLAADRLEKWGLIPESYQYKNFHLVPGLIGQGTGYLLSRMPGPAASRFQSARRSFPKDDLIFREFLFAKCWEQGVHRRYGELFLGPEWARLEESLESVFGKPAAAG